MFVQCDIWLYIFFQIVCPNSHWPIKKQIIYFSQAIGNLKAAAAEAKKGESVNHEQQSNIPQKSQVASTLPASFFDSKQANKQLNGRDNCDI